MQNQERIEPSHRGRGKFRRLKYKYNYIKAVPLRQQRDCFYSVCAQKIICGFCFYKIGGVLRAVGER